MVDLSSYMVTGTNDPTKQVSVNQWNSLLTSLETGSGGVANRTALAALSSSLSPVYLFEAGREGMFVWTAGDQSAKVTADTAQGIYVAPASAPTGASGAWVRVMGPSMLYKGEWWGLDTYVGTTVDAILNPILKTLLPKGARFRMPVCDVTASNEIRVLTEGVHFFGVSLLSSIIRMNAGVAKVLLTGERPGVHIFGLRLYGAYSAVSAGAPFTVMISPEYSMQREGYVADVTDCHVYGNYIEATAGVIFLSVNNGTSWYEAKRGSCHSNVIVSQYQAISLFLCGDIDVHHNVITLNYDVAHSEWYNIRLVGSYECDVHSNIMNGPGQSYGGIYGIAQVAANYAGFRRRGYDCQIRNNIIRNYNIPLAATEWDKTVTFTGNRCLNDTAGTETSSIGLYSFPSNVITAGLAETGGHLIVEDNYFEGLATIFEFGGETKSVRFNRNTGIGNNNSGGEGNSFSVTNLFNVAVRYTQITHNRFIQKDGIIFAPVNLTGTVAGEDYWIHDNVFGEHDSGATTRPIFSTSGSGTIHNAITDTAGTSAGSAVAAGSNTRHPLGLFAAYVA